eukprot:9924334-Alexandrium_andersonii.AAC.1
MPRKLCVSSLGGASQSGRPAKLALAPLHHPPPLRASHPHARHGMPSSAPCPMQELCRVPCHRRFKRSVWAMTAQGILRKGAASATFSSDAQARKGEHEQDSRKGPDTRKGAEEFRETEKGSASLDEKKAEACREH